MTRANLLKKLTKTLVAGFCLLNVIGVMNPTRAHAWYGVHLESYRTQARAELGWKETQRSLPALAGEASYRLVRVDLPEKGIYYRVIAGPFATFAEAQVLNDRLMDAGRFARVVAIDETAASVEAPSANVVVPPAVQLAQTKRAETLGESGASRFAAGPVKALSATGEPLAPLSGPAYALDPAHDEQHKLVADAPTRAKSARSLRKAPKTVEAAPSPATKATNGPREQDAKTPETTAKKDAPVKTLVGNLPNEFGRRPQVAPQNNSQEAQPFLPYVGLGFSF